MDMKVFRTLEFNPDRSDEDKQRMLVEIEHIEKGDGASWTCVHERKTKFEFLTYEVFMEKYRRTLPEAEWYFWLMESGISRDFGQSSNVKW